jgi:hypothetical protein
MHPHKSPAAADNHETSWTNEAFMVTWNGRTDSPLSSMWDNAASGCKLQYHSFDECRSLRGAIIGWCDVCLTSTCIIFLVCSLPPRCLTAKYHVLSGVDGEMEYQKRILTTPRSFESPGYPRIQDDKRFLNLTCCL